MIKLFLLLIMLSLNINIWSDGNITNIKINDTIYSTYYTQIGEPWTWEEELEKELNQ